ncbi:MAG: lipoprotein-releasing ABC transporter permease subunit LolE [Psychromonas sp.]|nr:lipoprotein-releasing ABC transporter permease subunit LolE [Psychromonas sp.]
MFRPLSLFVGLRYSRAKHKNKFVSFISIASILGISLGVMVLIVGLSTMNGFEKTLRDELLSVIPQGELEVVNGSFKNIKESLLQVQSNPHVLGVSPYIALNGILKKDLAIQALQIRAIAPKTESNVTNIERYIKNPKGWKLLNSTQNNIILGSIVAKRLGVKAGDHLSLLIPKKPSFTSKTSVTNFKQPHEISFKVVGIFSMGGQVDSTMAFIDIDIAKNLLKLHSANGIAFKVDEILQADNIARKIAYQINEYLYIKSWITSQGYLYQDIQMVKSLMYIILLLVIAVACFNIVSTLVMAVNEKRGDIAILKTMGAGKWSLRIIFVVQGAFNGFIGSILGLVLGVVVASEFTQWMKMIEKIIGHKFLNSDIYFIDFLPSSINYHQVFFVALLAFIMSVLATLYPAWRASNILPAPELGSRH